MRVVRSAYAHGKILAIDTDEARSQPGVHAVWTAHDIAGVPPIDFRLTRVEGLEAYRQPVLATDRVRYVGEPVAAVVAEDAYLAEDADQRVRMAGEEVAAVVRAVEAPGGVDAGQRA